MFEWSEALYWTQLYPLHVLIFVTHIAVALHDFSNLRDSLHWERDS